MLHEIFALIDHQLRIIDSPDTRFKLEVSGGVLYLSNKIFLWYKERAESGKSKNRLQQLAWIVYIFGLPPIVLLFALKQNWIAAAAELGGLPSMVLGLVLSFLIIKSDEEYRQPLWVKAVNWIAIITSVVTGLAFSWAKLGGIDSFTQVLEILLVIGFLVGTYQLAWDQPSGYRWFMLMNISCGMLMLCNAYYFMAVQQAMSFWFIREASRHARSKQLPNVT